MIPTTPKRPEMLPRHGPHPHRQIRRHSHARKATLPIPALIDQAASLRSAGGTGPRSAAGRAPTTLRQPHRTRSNIERAGGTLSARGVVTGCKEDRPRLELPSPPSVTCSVRSPLAPGIGRGSAPAPPASAQGWRLYGGAGGLGGVRRRDEGRPGRGELVHGRGEPRPTSARSERDEGTPKSHRSGTLSHGFCASLRCLLLRGRWDRG
jgi:hypothetical protein